MRIAIDHLLSGKISFGLVKVSSLQDLLSCEILTLLGKTVMGQVHVIQVIMAQVTELQIFFGLKGISQFEMGNEE